MPIFEYACSHCGHVFEKLVLTRNQDLPECPKCGGKRVEQKFSAFATAARGTSKSGRRRLCPFRWRLKALIKGAVCLLRNSFDASL